MPTGYTSYIEDRSITSGKDFLKLCIRNFGCCFEQRDESLSAPLKTHFEPHNCYYESCYKNALNKVRKYMDMSDEELYNEEEERLNKELESCQYSLNNKKLLNKLYDKIAKEVESWNPPTDEHYGIKEFALEQINISKENTDYYEDRIKEIEQRINDLSLDNISSIRNEILQYSIKDCDYYLAKIKEENERCKSRNKFMQEFIESLDDIDEE